MTEKVPHDNAFDDDFLRFTISEAARQLGISKNAVRRQIKDGILAAERDNGQWVVLIPPKQSMSQPEMDLLPEAQPIEELNSEETAEISSAQYIAELQAANEDMRRQHAAELAVKDDQIDQFRRRAEAAERERDELDAWIRRYAARRSTVEGDVVPAPGIWQRGLALLGQTIMALMLGLAILSLADYFIVGDAIPLLPEPTVASIAPAVEMGKPTSEASPSSTAMNASVGIVAEMQTRPPATVLSGAAPAPSPAALPSAVPSPTIEAPTPTITAAPVALGAPEGGWPQRDAGTWRASTVDGRYQMVLDGQTNATVSTALPDGDYQFSVDVTIARGGAGVVFLAEKPATFYRLVLSTDGAYTLQTIDDQTNKATTLIDWTESATLRQGAGATNELRVERRSDIFHFFANNNALTTFTAPQGQTSNRYGFALTSRRGDGEATFANLQGTYVSAVR